MILLFEIVGVLLPFSGCIAAWDLIRRPRSSGKRTAGAISLALVCIFGGGVLLLQDRITSLSVFHLGSIEANARKAETDARAISELRDRVEGQSATVDLVAKNGAEVRRGLDQLVLKTDDAISRVQSLDVSATHLEDRVNALRDEVDFSMTLARGSRDDRASFDKLLSIANSPNSPHQQVAWGVLKSIVTDPFLGGLGAKIEWGKLGVDPDVGTLPQLTRLLSEKLGPLELPNTVNGIWDIQRFSKHERLAFLAAVIRESPSIAALHRACMLMNTEAKLNKNILAYKEYLQWWDENSSQFEEKLSTH